MATTVSMPQLGETVTEGTILRWAKSVGDTIAEDEVLVEISTDKVDTEVPSPVAGTILEILVPEGDTVAVGVELVVIGDASEGSGESSPAQTPEAAESPALAPEPALEPQPEPEPAPEPAPEAKPAVESEAEPAASDPSDAEIEAFFAEPNPESPQLLSPVVRRLVREHQIDLTGIKGTGQGGRVTRSDVEAVIASGATSAPTPTQAPSQPEPVEAASVQPEPAQPEPAPTAPAAPAQTESAPAQLESAQPAPAAPAQAEPVKPVGEAGEEVALDRLRVRIAENMVKSLQTAAHVWTSVEVDYERVERVRQAHRASFKGSEGFSLTYLPFIARATIDALKAYPVVNSSFYLEEKKAVFHKNVDLGIAIDLNQDGLVVARVRNADGLRLVGIAREVRDLAVKGRDGKLGLDDLTGSTFTITNPGPFGSFMSAPVINIPNVAILSTDTVTKRPAVVTAADGQDMIAIRHIGYLGLSWDHRAFDGSTAVLFLRRIKENLETWDWEQELA